MSLHTLDQGFAWRFVVEFLCVVFVVYIIADANKLTVVIAAGKEDNGDA